MYLHLSLSLVIAILEQISVNVLEQCLDDADLDDVIKSHIYKSRAQYLEETQQIKRFA